MFELERDQKDRGGPPKKERFVCFAGRLSNRKRGIRGKARIGSGLGKKEENGQRQSPAENK